jgi:excisionase family DNA binding protein
MSHAGPLFTPLAVDETTAAEMLGVSPRTFFELRKNGDIQHIKIGRLVRYAVDDLRMFLIRKREETAALQKTETNNLGTNQANEGG